MQSGKVKGGSPNPSMGPPTATSPAHDGRAGAGSFPSPERSSHASEPWRGHTGSSVSPPTGAESDLSVDLSSNFLGGAVHLPRWLVGARGSADGEEFDPFPSLFMAAPFLNVHPKKQHRAECLLAEMLDKSMTRSTFLMWEAFAVRTRTLRGMREKAARHYIFGTAQATLRTWHHKATVLRVARMRLRTAVARWLRTQLQQTFDEWKRQRQDSRELFVSGERVADKTLGVFMRAFFDGWRDLIESQEHKREVLTRILMRTQDRSCFKAIHAWSTITNHLNRCRVLADRGLARTRHTQRELAFAAWQDLRLRGLAAIDMMDEAVGKWQAYLLRWCLDSMSGIARRNAYVGSRCSWLVYKRRLRTLRATLYSWLQMAAYIRKVAKVGGFIAAKWEIGGARSHFFAWLAQMGEQKRVRAAGMRVMSGAARGALQRVLSGWGAAAREAKVRKVRVLRAMGKIVGKVHQDCFTLWRGQLTKKSSVISLAERIAGKTERQLIEGAWAAWSESSLREASMRARGCDAFRFGKSRGSFGVAGAFTAWHFFIAQSARVQAVARRTVLKVFLRRTLGLWQGEASKQRIQGERFERLRGDCERHSARAFLDLWTGVHDRDVARANKLSKAMQRWDVKMCANAFDTWVDWWNNHVKAFEMHQRALERHSRRACALAIELWHHAGLEARLLSLKGGRLQAGHLLGVARLAFGEWSALSVRAKTLAARVEQMTRWSDERCVMAAWAGWMGRVEETNARASAIAKMQQRSQTACVRWTMGALYEIACEDKAWRDKLGSTIDRHEARVSRGAFELWSATVTLTAGLLRLKEAVNLSSNVALARRCMAAWHDRSVEKRCLVARGVLIVERRRRKERLVALWEWSRQARALVMLREGVLQLVLRRELGVEGDVLEAWRLMAARSSRNVRVAVASLERLQYALKARALCEWQAYSVCEARKKRGVWGLSTRSTNAVLQEHLVSWHAAAAHLARGKRAALRLLDSLGPRTLAEAWKEWARVAKREATVRSRWERKEGMAVRDVLAGAFDEWAGVHASMRARVEGFDKCVSRSMKQSLQVAVERWSETAAYKKRIRHVSEVTRERSELSARGRAMRHMQQAVRCNSKFEGMVRKKNTEELEYTLFGWRAYTAAVENKRVGLRRVMSRWETRTQREHLSGWKDATERLKAAWGRCELVEQRAMSEAAVRSVQMLLRNSKRMNRYRSLKESFDLRWLRQRVRSHFEAWRYWHGKKMAVKGVLDQVVDMM